MTEMTPREIVQELDKHIIGQQAAKRAVAIAMRNRWRRQQVVDEDLRKEITPRNILMIGPTGVGKTEIARRLATLAKAPFIKVEATKFTEVGYVGREVDSIIRDLVESAVKMLREEAMVQTRPRAEDAAEERVLDVLVPPTRGMENVEGVQKDGAARQRFRKMLREGTLDDKEIEIEVASHIAGVEIVGPPGLEEMTGQLQNLFQNMGNRRSTSRKLRVRDALKMLAEEEAAAMVNSDQIKIEAVERVEQNGIVFLDELDKIVGRDGHGPDVSRAGVQRDLLPLVEGCTVTTKYGMIKTDHILFIASGAFQLCKPSDLIPELQGRLPIRVELNALSVDDFTRILTEPDGALTTQYTALLKTELVELGFTENGIKRLAEVAWNVNEKTENIGARRLHTVMEKLLENISYEAPDKANSSLLVDAQYVEDNLLELEESEDLARYIL